MQAEEYADEYSIRPTMTIWCSNNHVTYDIKSNSCLENEKFCPLIVFDYLNFEVEISVGLTKCRRPGLEAQLSSEHSKLNN